MRKTPAKTTTRETTTPARKRRLSHVKSRAGEGLTSAEENTLRMHHGLEAGLHTPLPSNAVNSALRQYLLEIEKRAYEATGRHLEGMEEEEDAVEPVPARPKAAAPAKAKIVAKLKSR